MSPTLAVEFTLPDRSGVSACQRALPAHDMLSMSAVAAMDSS